jgi:hypothetical protein
MSRNRFEGENHNIPCMLDRNASYLLKNRAYGDPPSRPYRLI